MLLDAPLFVQGPFFATSADNRSYLKPTSNSSERPETINRYKLNSNSRFDIWSTTEESSIVKLTPVQAASMLMLVQAALMLMLLV